MKILGLDIDKFEYLALEKQIEESKGWKKKNISVFSMLKEWFSEIRWVGEYITPEDRALFERIDHEIHRS